MEMQYVKIWLDWKTITKELKDAEKGRLVDAIVSYAKGEDTAIYLTGNERFVFPHYMVKVDQDKQDLEDLSRIRSEAGSKGGRPRKQEAHASCENQENQMLSEESKKSEAYSIKHIADGLKPKEGDTPPIPPSGFAYSVEFERFWAAYPKKASKGAAYKAFQRIRGVSVDVMIYAIEQQRNSRQWQEANGQYIPNPATWLNRRDWENGPEMPGSQQPQGTGNIFADMAREGVFEDESFGSL